MTITDEQAMWADALAMAIPIGGLTVEQRHNDLITLADRIIAAGVFSISLGRPTALSSTPEATDTLILKGASAMADLDGETGGEATHDALLRAALNAMESTPEASDDYEAGYNEGFHHGRSTPRVEASDDERTPEKHFADLIYERGLRAPDSTLAVLAFKEVLAAALAAVPADGETEQWKQTDEVRIHYSFGVNSGRRTGTDRPGAVEQLVAGVERDTQGPVNLDKVERRTRFERETPWLPIPEG